MNYDATSKVKTMRNLRELGANIYSRDIDGNPDHEQKYPSALLATAGLDDKIYIWYPETGDIYKEYDLDPQIDSQVNLRQIFWLLNWIFTLPYMWLWLKKLVTVLFKLCVCVSARTRY